MTIHTELSLVVQVWSLEEPDCQPCPELQSICDLIDAPSITESPAERYPSNQPVRSRSTTDVSCFLNVDIRAVESDQMAVATVQIHCRKSEADNVEEQLRKIRSRSEVKTALLRGNLGLNVGAVDP